MAEYTRICIGCMRERRNPVGACEICGFYPAVYIPDANALPAKTILRKRYLIGKVLGAGEYGFTYIAKDLKQGTIVVINELFLHDQMRRSGLDCVPLCGTHEEEQQRWETLYEEFRKDARQMIRLAGTEGLVRGQDTFEENQTEYFVMEDLTGGTLREYLAKHGKPLSLAESLEILKPAMHALTALHTQKISHGQVTPDNLMFDGIGKLLLMEYGHLDSGVSHGIGLFAKEDRQAYMSPEQIAGMTSGTGQDVYSLAAVIYYCVTGRAPADAKARMEGIGHLISPRTDGAIITAAQEQALMKGLSLVPRDRYQTVEEFRTALTKAQAAPPKPQVSQPQTASPKPQASKPQTDPVKAQARSKAAAAKPRSVAAKAKMQQESAPPQKMTVAQAKKNAREVQAKKKKLPLWVFLVIACWVVFTIIQAYESDQDSNTYEYEVDIDQDDPKDEGSYEEEKLPEDLEEWLSSCWFFAQQPMFDGEVLADMSAEELQEVLNPEGYDVEEDLSSSTFQTYKIKNEEGRTAVNLFIADRDSSVYRAVNYARPDDRAVLPDHIEGITDYPSFEEFRDMYGITDRMMAWLKKNGDHESQASTDTWTYAWESYDTEFQIRYMESTGSTSWQGLEFTASDTGNYEFDIIFNDYGISSMSVRQAEYW